MGFFSSRKAEDNDNYQVSIGVSGAGNDKTSVVQVIRSRFYGKKGKEREDQPASFHGGVSTAQALSPVASAPPTPSRNAGPSILRNQHERPLPATPSKSRPPNNSPHGSPTPVRTADISRPSNLHAKNQSINSTSASTSPRKNTDTVTVTLAQRLNELAVANSEGLLNDDEYRILRQSLFERFSSNAAVPLETPVVPVTSPQPRPRKGGPTPDRPSSRPLSNFQVERPLSVASKTSAASGMADIFRRATGRRSTSKDMSDTSSIWSSTSKTSFFRIPKGLTKKSSVSSIHSNSSRVHVDTLSLSSKRMGSGSDRGHGEALASPKTRGAGSIRQLATPPSSFPGNRRGGQESSRQTNSIYDLFDEDHLTTVKDISQEILNVEAEAKRLMDAFNGLEVTTLAKTQRHRVRPTLRPSDLGRTVHPDSSWGLDSDGRSQRRINLADDAISMRSGTSAGTAPSVAPSLARSAYSTKKAPRPKVSINSSLYLSNSRPGSLHRKNSTSSVSSERRTGKMAVPPPVPALPNSISHGHLRAASSSNVSLVRSTGHLPMNTVPEDEKESMTGTVHTTSMETEEVETELEDIQRRREEVSQRYEARLEYLRAKLKGAQLHEKLMRK